MITRIELQIHEEGLTVKAAATFDRKDAHEGRGSEVEESRHFIDDGPIDPQESAREEVRPEDGRAKRNTVANREGMKDAHRPEHERKPEDVREVVCDRNSRAHEGDQDPGDGQSQPANEAHLADSPSPNEGDEEHASQEEVDRAKAQERTQ